MITVLEHFNLLVKGQKRMKRLIVIFAVLASACFVQAESAKDAWTKLVGPRAIKKVAFAYVENDTQLPNVLIYGDSISIGYTAYARKNLEKKANVYRLYSNGSDSSAVFSKMTRMHKVMRDKELEGHWDFEWDVIHFNVGLHDLKYFKDGKLDFAGEQVAPVDKYVKNLERVIKYFKKCAPKAKLIFATTTPVPANSGGRKEGDAKRYNEAALKLLKNYPEIAVNDLYTLAFSNQKKWWVKPGNVHFTSKGCAALGKEVSESVGKVLK